MYRGVFLRNGEHVCYSGPYDTYARAKASVTSWKNAGGFEELYKRDGHVESATPEWWKVNP